MNETAPETALRATETGDEGVEQGSTRDHCSRWSSDGHAFESHKPANSPVWIRRCSFCGWIDGAEITAELREAGWVDPEAAKTLQDECQVDLIEARRRTTEARAELERLSEQAFVATSDLERQRDALLPVVEAARPVAEWLRNTPFPGPDGLGAATSHDFLHALDALDSGSGA